MKGYIYTMFAGADPGHGRILNDPIFGKTPTLGACVPHIRRTVVEGDYVFAISGRIRNEKQFIVGGFRVAEKINAISAYRRFPENRMVQDSDGSIRGNVIVDSGGQQIAVDTHSNFESRVDNYLVGRDPVVLETAAQFERSRDETLGVLRRLFHKDGKRVFDIIGRHRKLDSNQVSDLVAWINAIKQ